MTNQVIPAEAVEAAARNLYVSEYGPWDGESGITSAHLTRARAALEAAAPYMVQAAYAEGFHDGHLAGRESMETE